VGVRPRFALAASFFLMLSTVVPAQETTPPPTPAQLAAMERVRPLVEAIWLEVRTPVTTEEGRPRYFWSVTDRLIAIGPDVVPFVVAELELMDPNTFHFAAYSLGRLGGPDAEAALRKAVRAADSIGGNFGVACKRYALYGLALTGRPDALDLMQTGLSMHGVQMVPDVMLVTQMAILIGPAALPTLEKQLETYRIDPEAVAKLQDTILGLGRAGNASVVPKLEPLLAHPDPEVRALAADSISRLAEPRACEMILPGLSSSVQGERRYVAKAYDRWLPPPCYKGMTARLEVERDMGVRAPLYSALVAMAGESSLDLFRTYLGEGDQYDQALAIYEIGQIGSPKGLNMLRALLTAESSATVVRALEAMGAIGGEGAIDTLMAETMDARRVVAFSARDVLVDMGVAQVAPRVAAALLGYVKDPVGDLSLRTPIAEWGDALVRFKYTEPIDDLKAAAAVQSDPEIKDAVESCARRLQLLKTNGDDVSLWAAAFASPFPDVRRLAGRRLAEIGSRAAVRAMKTRLQSSDIAPDERADALLAIGEARTQGAAELVELHLSEAAYDAWDLSDARSAAAWAARRLGGDRMVRALRLSAVRRDGRDWATLAYLAVLDKGASLPTLKTLRVRRLRYPEASFGHQEDQLDRIISSLAAGHEPKRFDVPPKALFELP
jgi:HEAT repeat protein